MQWITQMIVLILYSDLSADSATHLLNNRGQMFSSRWCSRYRGLTVIKLSHGDTNFVRVIGFSRYRGFEISGVKLVTVIH